MNEPRFPQGWDEQRVQEFIAELDARTDEKWIAADEAAASAESGDQAVITVPTELLPKIRRQPRTRLLDPRSSLVMHLGREIRRLARLGIGSALADDLRR